MNTPNSSLRTEPLDLLMNLPMQQIRMAFKRHYQTIAFGGALVMLLAGCASSTNNSLIDSIPTAVGGLPTGAPERPADPPAYPAVHDMPPPRTNATLTAEEQIQLENEMTATRTRQEVITGVPPTKRPKPTATTPPSIIPAASSNTSIY